MLQSVKIGDKVYWNDPEGISNDNYIVDMVCGVETNDELSQLMQEDYFDWEDAIISISNGYSNAEVTLNELS